ncbi:MAG: ATP-binding protein [Rhodovulum sulfidophilum]|uniref:ATP-binding protein n=1 Tax=Rhodovulum sulfidophilum TaxID=35806 RepID=A0A2W5N8Y3_RHOSU|nr:MAG: ATP-binding protein [Rhodovulum sulfidophilum]
MNRPIREIFDPLEARDFSRQQREAFELGRAWLRAPDRQVFRLFGLAGAGKTTLARSLARLAPGRVSFGAPTGKAALRMRQTGCRGAMTLHAMLYTPKFHKDGSVSFVLNLVDGPTLDAALIVVDEASMVNDELTRALLSLGRPILALGDPAQLPPPDGAGALTDAEPDYFLTEIHRQAEGSPIIELARRVREGEAPRHGDWGGVRVIPRGVLGADEVLAFDAVIVGRNDTRSAMNRRLRAALGHGGSVPGVGEKIVCCRNDRTIGIFNGEVFHIRGLGRARARNTVKLDIVSEEGGAERSVLVRLEHFMGGALSVKERRASQHFEWGYAITCHKAQGSAWDRVLAYDESACFGEQASRWLYTAITRAREQITIVR